MKKYIIAITVLLMTAALTLSLAACAGTGEKEPSAAASYISIKINPEVELTTSEDDVVTSFSAVNEDAEVLLSDTDLVGMSAEDAVAEIIEQATEAGYIDPESEDNNVVIGVIDEDGEAPERLKEKLMERVRQYFKNNGINGKVSEETLDLYAAQAAELGVSAGKMKMILRALDINPELDLQALKDIPIKDLIALLKDRSNLGIGYTLKEAFHEQNAALREKYARMFELEASIEALEAQIAAYEGDESGRAELESQLAALQDEYQPLQEAYQDELRALREAQKEERDALREQRKQEKQARVAARQQSRNNGKGK